MADKKRRKSYTTAEEKRFLVYTETHLQEAVAHAVEAPLEERRGKQLVARELMDQRDKLEQNIEVGAESVAEEVSSEQTEPGKKKKGRGQS
jgi:hypothetical protein